MAWLVFSKASADDVARLAHTASRFAAKLAIPTTEATPIATVETYLIQRINADPEEGRRLRRIWRKRVRRALRHAGAEGIAHGYIGRFSTY